MSTTLAPVVILAGGLATRLRPITESIPKCLVEIRGRPFIDYQLEWLRDQGVSDVVLSVGYRGEMAEEYVGDGSRFGLRVRFVHDGDQLMGTGGAVVRALDFLPEDFFLLYGDSYLQVSFTKVQSAFRTSGKLGLMTVFNNQNRWDSSNVEFRNGEIHRYSKRDRDPSMTYIDYGLEMFRKSAFDRVSRSEPSDLASLLEPLVKEGKIIAYEVFDRFYEVGSHSGISEFEAYIASVYSDAA